MHKGVYFYTEENTQVSKPEHIVKTQPCLSPLSVPLYVEVYSSQWGVGERVLLSTNAASREDTTQAPVPMHL